MQPYRAWPRAARWPKGRSGSVAIGAVVAIVRANLTEPVAVEAW